MVARAQLNRAIQRSLNEYGDVAEVEKRDRAGAAAAGAPLRRLPQSLSDRPLRKLGAWTACGGVHWLEGDTGALASDYGRQLSARSFDGAATAVDFIDELDNKLPLPTNTPAQIRDPMLLAVVDLHRMRQPEDASARSYCCGPPITKAEIEGQRAAFGSDTELYDYVRAAEAFSSARTRARCCRFCPTPRTSSASPTSSSAARCFAGLRSTASATATPAASG